MKLARTNKDFGGGSGKTVYESDFFSAIHWNSSKGPNTTLEFGKGKARFEGHQNLDSDSKCFE